MKERWRKWRERNILISLLKALSKNFLLQITPILRRSLALLARHPSSFSFDVIYVEMKMREENCSAMRWWKLWDGCRVLLNVKLKCFFLFSFALRAFSSASRDIRIWHSNKTKTWNERCFLFCFENLCLTWLWRKFLQNCFPHSCQIRSFLNFAPSWRFFTLDWIWSISRKQVVQAINSRRCEKARRRCVCLFVYKFSIFRIVFIFSFLLETLLPLHWDRLWKW